MTVVGTVGEAFEISMRGLIALICLSPIATPAFAQEDNAAIELRLPPANAELHTADDPEETIEEVLVTGEQPGPGLWQIRRGDHVLWVMGTHAPLPKKLTWRSRAVEEIIASSEEVLTPGGVSVKPEKKPGFWGSMKLLFKSTTLLGSLANVRNSPNGTTLTEILPSDVHARWTALKQQYRLRDRDVERWRPMFAADWLREKVHAKHGLTGDGRDVVWPMVRKLAEMHDVKITSPQILFEIGQTATRSVTPGLEVTIDGIGINNVIAVTRRAIKEFKQTQYDDRACFEYVLTKLEQDAQLEQAKIGARAWATGDIDALRRAVQIEKSPCRSVAEQAFKNASFVRERNLHELPQQLERRARELWLEAAESALQRNKSTFTALPIAEIFKADGHVAALRAKGYTVIAPDEAVQQPCESTEHSCADAEETADRAREAG